MIDRFAADPGFSHIKVIQRLRGGDLVPASQANARVEAKIDKKDPFRMETDYEVHHMR